MLCLSFGYDLGADATVQHAMLNRFTAGNRKIPFTVRHCSSLCYDIQQREIAIHNPMLALQCTDTIDILYSNHFS